MSLPAAAEAVAAHDALIPFALADATHVDEPDAFEQIDGQGISDRAILIELANLHELVPRFVVAELPPVRLRAATTTGITGTEQYGAIAMLFRRSLIDYEVRLDLYHRYRNDGPIVVKDLCHPDFLAY
jgi:hypothetical protein